MTHCLAERASAGYATQHEQAQIMRVDGCIPINRFAGFVVVVERLPREVDVVGQGLTRALLEHEVVQREREQAKDMQYSLSLRMFQAAVAQSGRANDTHFMALSARLLSLAACSKSV
jgi:hypothetical protein